MRRRMGRVVTASVVAACSVVAQGIGSADPLTDPIYYFYGDVTDPIGRAVAGATVSDAVKSTTTGSLGDYRLGERDVNKTFRLTALKSGMDAVSKDVTVVTPVDTQVNFTLQYRTSASLRDTTLSGVSGTDTVLDVTTYAPNPGLPGSTGGTSCVTVTDSGVGSTTNATFAGYAADGAAKWEWALTIGTGDKERSGVLTAKVATCDTATVLTRNASASYVIDNTPVTISDLQPKDGGNTAHAASQVVSATVRDLGGSGVDPASIAVHVVDTTTGVRRQLGGVSYNATTGRVTTAATSLAVNHRHRVEVAASDRSGNGLSFGQRTEADGGAYAMTVSLPKVDATIPSVNCVLGEANIQTQTKPVTCHNVVLDVAPKAAVSLSGSGRPGTGFVELTAPIQNARVRYFAQGTEVGSSSGTYAAGVSGYTALRYDVAAASDTTITVTPSGRTIALGTVTATAPIAALSATFGLGTTEVTPTGNTCSNPATVSGAVRCVSDPLETGMMVGVKAGYDANVVAQDHASKHGITVAKVGGGIYLAHVPNGVVAGVRADSRVAAVGRDVEYDYKVSFATLAKHDISTSALGAELLAESTDVTGTDRRVYDLTAAAGIIDDGFRRDTAVRQNVATHDSEVGQVSGGDSTTADSGPTDTEVDNATLFSIESTVGTAGRTSTTNGSSQTGSSPGSQYQWHERANKCGTAYDDNRARVIGCGRLLVAGDDGDSSKDYYLLHAYGTGISKAPWNLREVVLQSTPGSNSGWEWYDANPKSSITAEPCKNLTLSIGYTSPQKGWSIGLSTTKTWCEKYLPEWLSSPGNFVMRWKGNIEAEQRGLDFMHIVKVPAGRGVSYTIKGGYSYSWF